ncbi:DgyrCDS1842 [Dimorphilus gyrociliatus]|uniref:DgyrCDS1842 n=1 Tax=Dimorphilus gyrociliatus TaxID=2664684 RepID=A0A7I8VDM5_9ANNE|nr:DgyrCDS1842 [Dimorphilus gyrociliatus]
MPLRASFPPTKSKPINSDRLKLAKELVEKAIRNKKIFTIQGPYRPIRAALRRRGWVERFYKPSKLKSPRKNEERDEKESDSDDDDLTDADDDDGPKPWEEEDGIYGIMSRMVRNIPPTFIWCIRSKEATEGAKLRCQQIINHYSGAGSFTTKSGLCLSCRDVPWFEKQDPNQFLPRSFRIANEEDRAAFVEDFRLTACESVLKWVLERNQMTGESTEDKDSKPMLPLSLLTNAIAFCKDFIRFKAHDDLDDSSSCMTKNSDSFWDDFLSSYYKLVHDGGWLPKTDEFIVEIKKISDIFLKLRPQHKIDGLRNVWVIKPGCKSRGRGIRCSSRLEDIVSLSRSAVGQRESKWVVQKYVERPLLIHSTKFDIRQWFLVTDWNPLTIWFYKTCYIRFCSKVFTLDNLEDVAVHLSNQCVQKHCVIDAESKIPKTRIWSLEEFKSWLKEYKTDKWDEKIYPGMKNSITCTLQASQDSIDCRKNSFELFGADFMIADDLEPWLIEINCSPTMGSGKSPTLTRLMNDVQEDTVKVILDRRFDKNSDTGMFELIYKANHVALPPYIGLDLSVSGTKVCLPVFKTPRTSKPAPESPNESAEEEKPEKRPETRPETPKVKLKYHKVKKPSPAIEKIEKVDKDEKEKGTNKEEEKTKRLSVNSDKDKQQPKLLSSKSIMEASESQLKAKQRYLSEKEKFVYSSSKISLETSDSQLKTTKHKLFLQNSFDADKNKDRDRESLSSSSKSLVESGEEKLKIARQKLLLHHSADSSIKLTDSDPSMKIDKLPKILQYTHRQQLTASVASVAPQLDPELSNLHFQRPFKGKKTSYSKANVRSFTKEGSTLTVKKIAHKRRKNYQQTNQQYQHHQPPHQTHHDLEIKSHRTIS